MKALYELENISKVYSSKKRTVKALNGVTLSLPQSGLFAFTGASGCGKTTLLNLLGAIDKPTSGRIFFDGIELNRVNNKEADAIRNNDIAFVFQEKNLLSDETVFENISLPLNLQGEKSVEAIVKDSLEKVGLPNEWNREVKNLSGGQAERVAIARAIAKGSKTILCDEPTANLDADTAKYIFQLLKDLSKDKLIVVVTHNDSLAREFCDAVYVFKDSGLELDFGKNSSCSDSLQKEHRPISAKKARISTKVFIKTVYRTFVGAKLSAIVSFFAFITLFVLFFNVFSLYYYNQITAFEKSFRENDEYVIRLSKYQEGGNSYALPTGELYYEKFELLQQETKESDVALVPEQDLQKKICNSYFFNLPFKGFALGERSNSTALSFYAENFLSIIPLATYDVFNQPLVKGRYPEKDNEIAIYDYMEESLIRYGIIEDSALDKQLASEYYGVTFQVVGVLQSSYKSYLYLKDEPLFSFYGEKFGYEKSYLSELKTIFCLSNYFETILPALNKTALFDSITIRSDLDPDITKEMGYQVEEINSKEEFMDYDWDFLWESLYDRSEITGFAITKKTAMALAGVADEAEFDAATFNTDSCGSEAFCKSFFVYAKYWQYEKNDLFPAYTDSIYGEFLGIMNEDFGENGIFFISNGSSFRANGDFKGLYLLLTKDKKENIRMIEHFLQPEKKDDNYYAKLDSPVYGLVFYNENSIIINNANDYIEAMVKVLKTVTIILSAFAAIFMLYYSLNVVKNNFYKIAIFKSMGVGTTRLSVLFSSNSFITFIIGFITAIPFSYLTMKIINAEFLKDYGLTIPILNIEPRSFGIALIVGIGVLLCGIIYPMLKLAFSSPSSLISSEQR